MLTAARFAFQPWHSAVEFKRYLHRFIQEFPRINSLAGVDRTPFNQYDSIILPLETYLKEQGVEFRYGTYQSLFQYGNLLTKI
jgi:oleate hydratase